MSAVGGWSSLLGPLVGSLGATYSAIMRARNSFYDSGRFSSFECGRPVISVGNITAGGTGKTPFTAWLAEELARQGRRPAIISRGYRSKAEGGVARVDTNAVQDATAGTNLRAASIAWGDEPVMLSQRLPATPIFVGRDKVAVAREAVKQTDADVVIADDAFQHRRLKRNFDIVLLDATEPDWHWRPLPLGRLREPLEGLARAHALVLTKVNLASNASRDQTLKRIEQITRDQDLVAVEFDSRLTAFVPIVESNSGAEAKGRRAWLLSGAPLRPEALAQERLLLVSAIGRPSAFANLVEIETGAVLVGHEIFPDHHLFTTDDFERIGRRAVERQATRIVMTEKDAVKIPTLASLPCEVLVSRLEARPRQPMDEFHARLVRSLR